MAFPAWIMTKLDADLLESDVCEFRGGGRGAHTNGGAHLSHHLALVVSKTVGSRSTQPYEDVEEVSCFSLAISSCKAGGASIPTEARLPTPWIRVERRERFCTLSVRMTSS